MSRGVVSKVRVHVRMRVRVLVRASARSCVRLCVRARGSARARVRLRIGIVLELGTVKLLNVCSLCCEHRIVSLSVKPQSHRIVRLLDHTIGCYLANVRPIGNVCYDRQQRSHTSIIGLSSWW